MSSLSFSEDLRFTTDAVTKHDGPPTIATLRLTVNELAAFASDIVCELPQAAGHGHSFLCHTDRQWLAMHGVTDLVPVPTHPGPLVGTTHLDRHVNDVSYRQFMTYQKVDKACVRLLQTIYSNSFFVDLQDTQGQIMGYTTKELLAHLTEMYVDLDELEDDILANEALLSEAYDPNDSPQEYWAKLQNCKRLAIELGDTNINDVRLMRVAFHQFRSHAHLDDAAKEWKKTAADTRTWTLFKKHFNKAIQRTKKNQGTFSQMGIANGAIAKEVTALTDAAFSQHETILSLQSKIDALEAQSHRNEKANSATTPTSVMDMMVEAFKHSQPSSVITTKSKGQYGNWTSDQRNDATGKRVARRYDNDKYCHRCGYDVNHTSATCKYVKPEEQANHRPTATAANPMGGSMRNMHLRRT